MTTEHDAWLQQVLEPPIEPDLPICDPHHHLWDYPESRYLLDELLEDTAGHNVVSTVFVECESMYRVDGPPELLPVGETEFVEALAKLSARRPDSKLDMAAGIVSFADLALGSAVEEVLEAHRAESPKRFRGIRHASGWEASPEIRNSHTDPPKGLLLDTKFREGFAVLEKMGLSFDAWLYHTQLADLADLARAFPGTTIIIDHFGGPLGIGPYAGKREAIFEGWKKDMDALAAYPNTFMKLGGLVMPLNGWDWHKRPTPPTSEELATATAPYHLHCIEQFGVERCMFESNFPVDRTSTSYTVLWNSFKRMVSDFSASEKAALFHDTAVRAYRL